MIKISHDQNNYVTVEIFNAGLNEIRGEIKALGTELKSEIRVNAVRIEELKNAMNWGLATLSIVIAIVGFGVMIAPIVREFFRERREEKQRNALTPEKIQNMIDASIGKILREKN